MSNLRGSLVAPTPSDCPQRPRKHLMADSTCLLGTGAVQNERQHGGIDRFEEVILRAILDRLDRTLHAALGSTDDDGGAG